MLARVLCAMASCHESISRPTRPHGTLISVQCVAHFFIFTDGSRGDSSVRSGEAAAILVNDSASVRIAAVDSESLSSPAVQCGNERGHGVEELIQSRGSVRCRYMITSVKVVRIHGRTALQVRRVCSLWQKLSLQASDIASATPHCHFAIRTLCLCVWRLSVRG